MGNPYEKQPGFALRVRRAKKAYEAYGRDYSQRAYERVHSREIDNCFEMYDGKAVVWALMAEALGGNTDLAEGIKRTGEAVWPHWMQVYQAGEEMKPAQRPMGLEAYLKGMEI